MPRIKLNRTIAAVAWVGMLAGSVAYIEALFAQRMSYSTAMAATAVTVFIGAIVMTALGRERRGIHFGGRLVSPKTAPEAE